MDNGSLVPEGVSQCKWFFCGGFLFCFLFVLFFFVAPLGECTTHSNFWASVSGSTLPDSAGKGLMVCGFLTTTSLYPASQRFPHSTQRVIVAPFEMTYFQFVWFFFWVVAGFVVSLVVHGPEQLISAPQAE